MDIFFVDGLGPPSNMTNGDGDQANPPEVECAKSGDCGANISIFVFVLSMIVTASMLIFAITRVYWKWKGNPGRRPCQVLPIHHDPEQVGGTRPGPSEDIEMDRFGQFPSRSPVHTISVDALPRYEEMPRETLSVQARAPGNTGRAA